MGRWQPDARARLESAALEEFGERGYDTVTVAEIAARAGLTERTFYRHFADKREVLFAGQDVLRDLLVERTAEALASAPPWAALERAFTAAAEAIAARGELPLRRQTVVEANQALRERELYKLDLIARSLGALLAEHGADGARTLGEASVAAFKVAFEEWVRVPGAAPLTQRVAASFATLRRGVAAR